MSITEATWKADWDKIWDVTTCESTGTVLVTDEVKLEPHWKAKDDFESADIKLWRDGKEHSTWGSGFTIDSTGKILSGSIGSESFTITRSDPATPGEKATLSCCQGLSAAVLASNIVESLPRAGGALGAAMAWVTTKAITVALWCHMNGVCFFQFLAGANTGGQPGTWSAEDGGNRNGLTITPYDIQPHVRRRRA